MKGRCRPREDVLDYCVVRRKRPIFGGGLGLGMESLVIPPREDSADVVVMREKENNGRLFVVIYALGLSFRSCG